MKRSIMASVLIAATGLVILSDACKKKDTAPPTITLIGGSTINQSLPFVAGTATWADPGVTAVDNAGNDITSSVAVDYTGGPVNPNLKGTYYISYTVTDKSGIAAPARIRTVNIVNDADIFAGAYSTSIDSSATTFVDTIRPFPVITTSDTINDLAYFTNFGGLDSTGFFRISATFADSTVNIPVPQVVSDSASVTGYFYGIIISAVQPTAIDIKYQWRKGINVSTNLTHYRR